MDLPIERQEQQKEDGYLINKAGIPDWTRGSVFGNVVYRQKRRVHPPRIANREIER